MVPIESLDFRNLERYCALNASFIVPMRPPPEGFGDSDALQREKLVFQSSRPCILTNCPMIQTLTIMILFAPKCLLIIK